MSEEEEQQLLGMVKQLADSMVILAKNVQQLKLSITALEESVSQLRAQSILVELTGKGGGGGVRRGLVPG